MADSGSSKAPRIAIKFGATRTLKSASKPQKLAINPSSLLGKRPHNTALGDSDSDSEDESHSRNEEITGFEDGGIVTKEDEERRKNAKGPRVIMPPPTRNWMDEIRAKHAQNAQTSSTQEDEEPKIKWGLNYVQKKTSDETKLDEKKKSSGPNAKGNASVKNLKQQALDRLLGNEDASDLKVIQHDETEAFKRSMKEAADVPDLEEYDNMPVEEFGAAFLRGLGWDGKDNGVKSKEVKRRPNQLGLGAKELKGEEDLGGWDHRNKKRLRLAEYNERKFRDHQDSRGSYCEDRERDKGRPNHHHHNRERQLDIQRQKDRDRKFQEREKEKKEQRDRGYVKDDRDRCNDLDRDRYRYGRSDWGRNSRGHSEQDCNYDRKDRDRDNRRDRDHLSSRR